MPQEAADTLKRTLANKAIQGKFLHISDISAASIEAPVLPPPPSRPAAAKDSNSVGHSELEPRLPPAPATGGPTGQHAAADKAKLAQVDTLNDNAAVGGPVASNSNAAECATCLDNSNPLETPTALDDDLEPDVVLQVCLSFYVYVRQSTCKHVCDPRWCLEEIFVASCSVCVDSG